MTATSDPVTGGGFFMTCLVEFEFPFPSFHKLTS